MESCTVNSLLVLSALLVCGILAQTDDATEISANDPTAFSQYMLINDFNFGKLQPDALNPGTILVIRPLSVARLTVNNTSFRSETIVGSESEKDIVDDIGTNARFNYMFDMAQITDQKIWIASELTYNCLRKIDVETLEVSTFSGTCDSRSEAQPYVGDLTETKWTLPGLMVYVEADKKLYISSDGGLRVLDMLSSWVDVLEPVVATIYDMILTSSNTLLLLHNSEISELNPSNSSNTITRWNKADAPEGVEFSFIFDMTKVDENRYYFVDDTKGIWLLNLETGDLTDICPDGAMTLTGGAEKLCYDSPSAILHISYIDDNLHILSYWQTTDFDSTFELGIFLPESNAESNGDTIILNPDDNTITLNATKVESTNTTRVTDSTLVNASPPAETPDLMSNTTESLNTTESFNVTKLVVDVNAIVKPFNETLPRNISTAEIPEDSTSVNATQEETISSMGNDTQVEIISNTTSDNSTLEESATTTEFPMEVIEGLDTTTERKLLFSTSDYLPTKYVEEKTAEITTPSEKEKSGKSETGASANAADRISANFVCWNLLVVAGLASF